MDAGFDAGVEQVAAPEVVDEGLKWAVSPPTPDATRPEIVGTRGQRVRFYTTSDLDDIYEGCREMGLRVLSVRGTLIYSHRFMKPVTRADGSKGVELHEAGVVEEGEDPIRTGGMYQVTCSLREGVVA